MKKRLLALAAMMLCIVMALSSCALFTPTINFSKFVQKDVEPESAPVLTTINKLDIVGLQEEIFDWTVDYSEDAVVLIDTNEDNGLKTTTIYNVATNQIVWKESDTESKSSDSTTKVEYSVVMETLYTDYEPVTMMIVEKKSTTTKGTEVDVIYDVTVLTETGAEVVAFKDVNKDALEKSIWSAADLFSIQHKVYRVSEDGSVTFAFDWSDLIEQPSILLQKAGNYYIDYNIEQKSVFIYNTNLELTATYFAPMYGDDYISDFGEVIFNASVLSNGNVLIQYTVHEDAMAQKYTFLMMGQKYNLYSVLLDAKTGKAKELQLDYLIGWVEYGTDMEYMGVSEKIENVAVGYLIEDHRINHNEVAAQVFSLTNNGRVAGVLEAPAVGVMFEYGYGFEMVGKNRWELPTVDGRTFMVDEKGVILGENFTVDDSNADVFLSNERVYDWDLKLKADFQRDAELVWVMDYGVLCQTQKGEVKLYFDDETKTFVTESQAKGENRTLEYLSRGAYMIVDTTDADAKYEIYNSQGVRLTIITDKVSTPELVKVAGNGAILLCAEAENGSVVYYRVG